MPERHIVVLNGVSSVGKSSTARALQAITAKPFLHIAMDQFIDMAAPRLFGADGLLFETAQEHGRPSVVISTGPRFQRLMSGMRHAIAAMADQGNDLIVDDVFWSGEEEEYRRLLGHHQLQFVGLFAPMAVVEERERLRGDRALGLARWQYARVHQSVAYDFKVDMTETTPAQAAALIREAFDL